MIDQIWSWFLMASTLLVNAGLGWSKSKRMRVDPACFQCRSLDLLLCGNHSPEWYGGIVRCNHDN